MGLPQETLLGNLSCPFAAASECKELPGGNDKDFLSFYVFVHILMLLSFRVFVFSYFTSASITG